MPTIRMVPQYFREPRSQNHMKLDTLFIRNRRLTDLATGVIIGSVVIAILQIF